MELIAILLLAKVLPNVTFRRFNPLVYTLREHYCNNIGVLLGMGMLFTHLLFTVNNNCLLIPSVCTHYFI